MKLKFANALSLALIMAMLFTSVGLADNVINDVVAGGNDTFTLGGSAAISYEIKNTNSNNSTDPQNSCNPADGSAATLTIVKPAQVTVTPASRVYTSCETFQLFTFTASASGDYAISVSVSDSGTGTYNTSNASFTLHVLAPSDTTPPVIGYTLTPSSPDGSNGWYKSNVTLTWTVSEPESPASLVKTGCVNQNITSDQAATSYSCSATSTGGSAAPVSVSIQRDATQPVVSWSGGINNGDSFVYGSVPAVPTCSATDGLSGPDGCGVTGYGTSVGSHTLTATAMDKAGNVKTETRSYSVSTKTLTASIVAANKEYDGNNTASFSCSLSGVVGTEDVTCSGGSATFADKNIGSWLVTANGLGLSGADAGNYTVNSSATDMADITAKALTASIVAANKEYNGNNTASFTCSLSGVVGTEDVTCSGGSASFADKNVGSWLVTATGLSLSGADAGNYTVNSTATDTADITARPIEVTADAKTKILGASDPALTYQVTSGSLVVGDSFSGALSRAAGESAGTYPIQQGTLTAGSNYALTFVGANLTITYAPIGGMCYGAPGHQILQPINADGTSVFKKGSTVPAKFRVCGTDPNVSIGTPGVVTSFKLIASTVNPSATLNEDAASTTPDTAFRWSSTDQQWIFNINTKNLTAGVKYTYEIKLNDGSSIVFSFTAK